MTDDLWTQLVDAHERIAKLEWMLKEAIEDGPGYFPTNALELRWEEHCKGVQR